MKVRFKTIFFILAIPLLLGGLLHYTISYQIKNILHLIVEKESNNTYGFHASKIEVSFWNKSFRVENARLISLDTTQAKTHYNIEIPKMYMEIHSWSEIIFNRKLSIDTLSFTDSKIRIHEKTIHKIKTKNTIHLNEVFKTCDKILRFLEVKSFSIGNGGFSYKTIHSLKELTGEGINFSIRNLTEKNKEGHLLYSDDLSIDMKNQEWNMPDGIHTVSFKRLNFSGKSEFFELDSFTVKSAATGDKGEVTLHTDKFYFNSVGLESMYLKNTLTIDTLLCIRPVLTLGLNKTKRKSADTPKSLANYLPGLFKASHINYIHIEDGQILLKKENEDSSKALIQKSNLKIYNLSAEENRTPYLKTDSILFGSKDIKFITPDSTFQIVASELLIINDDLVLRNSFFGPLKKNTKDKSISFSAPEFRLNNINFVDLIQKKLNATQAELYSPNIIIKSAKNDQKKTDTSVATIEHFYSSLHAFRELVGVQRLRIIDGHIHIKNSDKQRTTINIEGINALILPVHFVHSTALVDIKHSLPEIKISKISIASDKMNIDIDHFSFDGVNRKSHADQVHIAIANKIDIQGNYIYWEIFDWDLFQQYKRIDIKSFSAQKLSVKVFGEENKKTSKTPGKDLPDIRVGKSSIEQLSILSTTAKDTLSFTARNVVVDSLRTIKRFFAWKKVDGIYENIHIQKEHLTAHIKLLKFNVLTEVVIQQVYVHKKDTNTSLTLKIPAVTILGNFYSTDFSKIHIQKLNIQNPSIDYTSITNGNKKNLHKDIVIPINLVAKELIVSNAQIDYKSIHSGDTLSTTGKCSIKLENIVASKTTNNIASFDALIVDIEKLYVTKKAFLLEIPLASIQSRNGTFKLVRNDAIAFESNLNVNWNGITFSKTMAKNNGLLHLENLSGSFIKNQFIFATDKAVELQSILNHLRIDKGAFSFSSDNVVFNINEIQWQNTFSMLSLNGIIYHPKLSLEAAVKNASTQFDYLELTGKSIRLKNINMNGTTSDSVIHIQNVILDQLELSATRDKTVPKKTVKLKEMPTKIIRSIAWPIVIDTVSVLNSKVTVHQIEAKTTATIPIENIYARITNVTNRNTARDSLYLVAHAKILDVAVNSFTYTESYTDSLSYFHASSNIVPGKFSDLNTLTVPLAALAIDNGYSTKMNAAWVGNKYAAIGAMNFIYKDLEVHLLSKSDTSQTNFTLMLENKVAKEIINKNNKKVSVIYFERNAQKQIFNYWLKATLQGVYSAVGLKSNEKYLKHYNKAKQKYHLPESPIVNK